MSQFYVGVTAAPLPPTVPTQFNTQNGNATPSGNILIINGFDSTENNDNGIISKGGVAGTGTVNEVDIILTNRSTGQVTTSDVTPTTIITFSLGATPGVFYINGDIAAYDLTDIAGGAYSFTSGARTDGVTATEIGTEFKDVLEDVAMITSDYAVSVSGNNVIISVIGIAGKTIHWNCYLTYRFVS